MPKVSVIVPNYNHAKFLHQRIDSILNQTFQDFEIIILDDASTDTSKEIIEQYRNNTKVSNIVFSEKNSGSPFIQWNKGIEIAQGDYIWIAESDDFAAVDFLSTLVPVLDNNRNIVIAYTETCLVDKEKNILRVLNDYTSVLDKKFFLSDFKISGYDYINKFLVYMCTIPNASGTLLRKEKVVEIGGANQEIQVCADWMLYFQLLMLPDAAIFFSSKKLNFRTQHETSVTASKKMPWEFYNIKLRKNLTEILSGLKNYTKVAAINNKMYYNDIGRLSLWYIENDDFLKGIFYLVQSVLFSESKFFFLWNGIFWIKYRLKRFLKL